MSIGDVPAGSDKEAPSGSDRAGSDASATFRWGGETMVFVTQHGDVVHAFPDCSGIRGFRGVVEPDPAVYRVPLRSLACAGRRVCRKCYSDRTSSALGALDGLILALHDTSEPVPWFDFSVFECMRRGAPSGDPGESVAPAANVTPRDRGARDERCISDLAKELGLTIEEARDMSVALGLRRRVTCD